MSPAKDPHFRLEMRGSCMWIVFIVRFNFNLCWWLCMEASDPEKYYRIYESIWRNMERENNLMNHRITWAILLSAGVFAATTFLVNAILQAHDPSGLKSGALFAAMALMAGTAIIFSLRTMEGVKAAQSQLDYLLETYTPLKETFERDFGLPRPFGDKNDHLRGNHAADTFPKMMLWIWIFIFLVEIILASVCFYEGAVVRGLSR